MCKSVVVVCGTSSSFFFCLCSYLSVTRSVYLTTLLLSPPPLQIPPQHKMENVMELPRGSPQVLPKPYITFNPGMLDDEDCW